MRVRRCLSDARFRSVKISDNLRPRLCIYEPAKIAATPSGMRAAGRGRRAGRGVSPGP